MQQKPGSSMSARKDQDASADGSDAAASRRRAAEGDSLRGLLQEVACAPALPPPGQSARGCGALAQDELLGDHYQIISPLPKQGGMGVVYLARDLRLGRQVVVKQLRVSLGAPEEIRRLFDREAIATARLSHPNIVTVHFGGVHRELPYLVLEHLRGESLAERLARGPLEPVNACQLLAQLLLGLEHAHGVGVLHRDLKPANIFLEESGRLKILDFGLAALDAGNREDGCRSGTPGYMAPEQQRGDPQDERTDLWAVGALLFESLTGALPWPPNAPIGLEELERSERFGRLPQSMRSTLARALQPGPEDRFQSAQELRRAIEQAADSLAEQERGSDLPYRFLEAFDSRDACWFFGREEETARLGSMVERRPLVAVVGASGAGKSSLIQAGLLAHLHRSRGWRVAQLRPGAHPVEALARSMAAAPGPPAEGLAPPDATSLLSEPGLAGQWVRRRAMRSACKHLVFVDQLEELLWLCQDRGEREVFCACLASMADDVAGQVHVVLALREDCLARLAGLPLLGDLLTANLLPLGKPDETCLAAALCGPAERLGVRFEDRLIAEVLEALREEPVPLPLLQVAASRLWSRRDPERSIRLEELRALGGVAGVLVAHADQVVDGLPGEAEREIAHGLLCDLVGADGSRRPRTRGELLQRFDRDGPAQRVLEHLQAGRLVRGTATDPDAGDGIELAHEMLLTRWPRLRSWLSREAERTRTFKRLADAARAWEQAGRPAEQLWGARALGALLPGPASTDPPLGPHEADFLRASRRRTRRLRWLRLLLASSVSVVLACLVIALFTFLQVFRAEKRATARLGRQASMAEERAAENERLARSRSLAARAVSVMPEDAELGLLLAREAVAVAPTFEAVQALRDGVREQRVVWRAEACPRWAPPPAGISRGMILVSPFSPKRRMRWAPTQDGLEVDCEDERVRLSPDGKILSWQPDASVDALAPEQPRPRCAPPPGSTSAPPAVSQAAGVLVFGRLDGSLDLLDTEDCGLRLHVGRSRTSTVGLAFSPDGRELASLDQRGEVVLWRAQETEVAELRGASELPDDLRLEPGADGVKITTGQDGVGLWDRAGELELLLGHACPVTGAWPAADGAYVLTGCADGSARLWDRQGVLRALMHGHRDPVTHGVIGPGAAWMATASQGGTVRLWDRAGQPMGTWQAPQGVEGLSASADGRYLISQGYDGSRAIWTTRLPDLLELAAQRSTRALSPEERGAP
jgi:hypothetical protein